MNAKLKTKLDSIYGFEIMDILHFAGITFDVREETEVLRLHLKELFNNGTLKQSILAEYREYEINNELVQHCNWEAHMEILQSSGLPYVETETLENTHARLWTYIRNGTLDPMKAFFSEWKCTHLVTADVAEFA